MSTAARKARKRAGEKFHHPEKVATPITERHIPEVVRRGKTGFGFYPSNRAAKKAAAHLTVLLEAQAKGGIR